MNKFGWSYPPSAANDPLAPYNQDAPIDNAIIKDAFSSDYSSPYDLYRSVYKYTDCGPSIGFLVEYEDISEDGFGIHYSQKSKWYYCNDLRTLGTWADLDSQGTPILAISVSSIVEGSDAEVLPVIVEIDQDNDDAESLRKNFWNAVEDINQKACDLWDGYNAE